MSPLFAIVFRTVARRAAVLLTALMLADSIWAGEGSPAQTPGLAAAESKGAGSPASFVDNGQKSAGAALLVTAVGHAQVSFTDNGQQLNRLVGRGVVLADFNGDGALDAFVTNEEGYRVYFGDGHGQFTDSGQQLAKATGGGGDPAIFDLNGDGRPEVITGTTVWIVDAQGRFTAQPLLVESTENVNLGTMAFADLNGDGHKDLFALRTYTAARVYLNDGHGRFRDTGQPLGDGTIGKGQLAQIALGDIDGNGTIDAITAGWRWEGSTECPNHVWLNDGQGNFRDGGQSLDEGESHAHGLTLADLNGDGRPDLVMALQDRNRSGRIFLNDGHGHFVAGQNLGGAGGESAVLADFDGDGTPDLFMAQSTPPSRAWLNDGKGNFRDSGVRLGLNCYWDAAAGDFNADGKPDVFAPACIFGRNGLTAAPAQVWLNNTAARGAAPVTQAGAGGLRIPYPGNRLPGATPDVFAPGLLSRSDSAAPNLSFTREGKTIYFRRLKDGVNTTMVTRYDGGAWSEPEPSTVFPEVPWFTNSGRAYYADGEKIFVKEPVAGGWSDSKLVAEVANAGPVFSVADSGNLYVPIGDPANPVPGIFEIHVLRLVDGIYQAPEKLPGSISSDQTKQHLFVAPDESYLLFDSDRGLNLSVRNPDGSWSPSRTLGGVLNTRVDWRGSVSPDGLALFYYSQSDNQLHWLSWPPLLQQTRQRLLAPAVTDVTLALGGTALGDVTAHDLGMVTSSVPDSVETLRRAGRTIPEQVNALLTAARAAGQDRYRAYRLFARALGWAWGEDKVEPYEVAASFNVFLNRAIFTGGETITLTMKPLFTLGHPLTLPCTVESWLETEQGLIAGTEQKLPVTEIKTYRFEYPTDALPDGVIAVGYRLSSPGGQPLSEQRHAVIVAKDVQSRAARLQARFDALKPSDRSKASPASLTALETIDFCLRNLAIERTRFDGHWMRTSHPFGMSGNLTNAALGEKRPPSFPMFTGRMRYPDDFAYAENLADALRENPGIIRTRMGDMALAYCSTADGTLLHYRLFVPSGKTKLRALVVALHSGEGDLGYLYMPSFRAPNEKTLQELAEEKGFIIAVPNGERGFTGARGERDLLALMDRLQAVYSIEPRQTFLMGWSLGGAASWRFAMKYPGRLAAMASVTGAAEWINQENTRTAIALPVLQCEPEHDQFTDRAQRTRTQATTLLRNATFKTYPGTDHMSVWVKALPDVFAFFEARLAGSDLSAPAPAKQAARSSPSAGSALPTPAPFVCDYLGEIPPGDEPQMFGRGTVSVDGKNTHALQFSPDGRMLVLSRYPDGTSYWMKRTNNGWSEPEKTSFRGKEVTFDAARKRLFYYDGGDLFWVQYTADGFSAKTRLDPKINTREQVEYYPCMTASGNLYFSRNSKWDQGRIMVAKPAGEDFETPVDLGDLVNAGGASHGFVAPDESYLLFNSPRAGSATKNDIWVSFRGADGVWSAPVNLGPRINRDAMAVLCPTVSPDGKYLFFTRLQEGGPGYVYWVSTRVIDEARARAGLR